MVWHLAGTVWFALTCSECPLPILELYKWPGLVIAVGITTNFLIICKGLLNPLIYALRIPEIRGANPVCSQIRASAAYVRIYSSGKTNIHLNLHGSKNTISL